MVYLTRKIERSCGRSHVKKDRPKQQIQSNKKEPTLLEQAPVNVAFKWEN